MVDWNEIFHQPDFYLQNITSDEEIERNFKYEMDKALRLKFAKTENIHFDVNEVYKNVKSDGLRSKVVLDRSIEQHTQMCVENSADAFEARQLAKIANRRHYLSNSVVFLLHL